VFHLMVDISCLKMRNSSLSYCLEVKILSSVIIKVQVSYHIIRYRTELNFDLRKCTVPIYHINHIKTRKSAARRIT